MQSIETKILCKEVGPGDIIRIEYDDNSFSVDRILQIVVSWDYKNKKLYYRAEIDKLSEYVFDNEFRIDKKVHSKKFAKIFDKWKNRLGKIRNGWYWHEIVWSRAWYNGKDAITAYIFKDSNTMQDDIFSQNWKNCRRIILWGSRPKHKSFQKDDPGTLGWWWNSDDHPTDKDKE